MLKILSRLFRRHPKFIEEHKGKIKEAFTYRGVVYYMFEDIFTMPTIRGLQALDYYDEFNMRCTKDFLLTFVEAQEAILSNPKKLDLIKLATLTKYLRERLEMIPVPEHVYRLASVMFFSGDEDPFFFDRQKGAEKIEEWKKDPEILAFFLQSPLKDLIPYLDSQLTNISTYSAIIDRVNEIHLKGVSSVLSEKNMKVAM
jgi:hypothetical protein